MCLYPCFNISMNKKAKAKFILIILWVIVVGVLLLAVLFKDFFTSLLPGLNLYRLTLLFHNISVSLFFANAVIGMMWESRSLASGSKEVLLHTYKTVTHLDSVFSTPLIVLTLISGLAMTYSRGSLWEVGWLSVSFLLFILSGVIWIASDIPTQYKVKRLLAELQNSKGGIPEELTRLLKLRWWIGILGVLPLVIVFFLMVYKPDVTAVAYWF